LPKGLKWDPAEVHPLLGISFGQATGKLAYVLSPNSLAILAINRGKEGKDVLDVKSSLGISIEVLDLHSSVVIGSW